MKKENNLTISNVLTVLRMLLSPLVMYFILISKPYTALALFLINLATDLFDGYLARKRKETTTLGKILDPISDKLFYGFVLFGVLIKNGLLGWIKLFSVAVVLYAIGYPIFVKKKMEVQPAAKIINGLESVILISMIFGIVNDISLSLFALLLAASAFVNLRKMIEKDKKIRK